MEAKHGDRHVPICSFFFYPSKSLTFGRIHSGTFLVLSWVLVICCSSIFGAHEILNPNQTLQTSPYHNLIQTNDMNVIDLCWRGNPNWDSSRPALANCARGYGSGALGGKNGAIYVVTDPSDDPENPKKGTLRYGAIQDIPLWIIFQRDMLIQFQKELLVNSYKTIDGRGAKIEIARGTCITIENVSHVIIHGISIHDCKPGKPGLVRRTQEQLSMRSGGDGDGITVFASSNVWIDHCTLARCSDGLIDLTNVSTAITISNNYLTEHDEVMLFGHEDGFTADTEMKVTLAFNHFGQGLIQRLPRVRYGSVHIINNYYDQWKLYAIGGSSNPTILSEGNYYIASNNKEVTRRDPQTKPGEWKKWKWRSSKDVFLNGAYFVPSGEGALWYPKYSQEFTAAHGSMVPKLTSGAGPLHCIAGHAC